MTIGASAAKAWSATLTDPIDEAIAIEDSAELEERSALNIAAWRSYLPAECVDTMIAMGWDKST